MTSGEDEYIKSTPGRHSAIMAANILIPQLENDGLNVGELVGVKTVEQLKEALVGKNYSLEVLEEQLTSLTEDKVSHELFIEMFCIECDRRAESIRNDKEDCGGSENTKPYADRTRGDGIGAEVHRIPLTNF